MKTGRMGSGRARLLVAAFAVAGVAWTASPASAQQDGRSDCRCVDQDGQELEGCVCMRMPRMDRIAGAPWMDGMTRPRLGISVDLTVDAAEGARVMEVMRDGPAARAGIREGDLITHVDGRSLLEPLGAERESELDLDRSLAAQRLLALARDLEPGEEVDVAYLRDGTPRTATVEAEELSGWGGAFSFTTPEWDSEAFEEKMRALSDRMRDLHGPRPMRAPRPPDAPAPPAPFRFRMGDPDEGTAWFHLRGGGGIGAPWLARTGLDLVELKPGLASYFGVEGGVLVAEMAEDSPLGLRPGDVILEIDGRAVSTPGRVYDILATYGEEETIAFRIRREGSDMNVSGRIGAP